MAFTSPVMYTQSLAEAWRQSRAGVPLANASMAITASWSSRQGDSPTMGPHRGVPRGDALGGEGDGGEVEARRAPDAGVGPGDVQAGAVGRRSEVAHRAVDREGETLVEHAA